MTGKRSWIHEAAEEILALGKSAGASVKGAVQRSGLPTPGNIARGKQIADEVYDKWATAAGGAKNAGDNSYDAGRHAEWMYRTAEELGPSFAHLVGDMHELPAQAWEAVRSLDPRYASGEGMHKRYAHKMDYYNNELGRRAAATGLPYRQEELQLSPYSIPMKPTGAAGFYSQPQNLPEPARRAMLPTYPVVLVRPPKR